MRKALLIGACAAVVCMGTGGDAGAKDAAAGAGDGGGAGEKLTYSGPPVMDPSMATGMAAIGYASAKAAPEVMAKLFCYCGCDQTDSHSSLVDCFTGMHGMDCHICQEEAVLALKMYRDGATIGEIQRRVDAQFSNQYPFTTKTDALKKYEATRVEATPTPATMGPEPAGAGSNKSNGSVAVKGKLKVKPGMTVGNCCGGDHGKDGKKK